METQFLNDYRDLLDIPYRFIIDNEKYQEIISFLILDHQFDEFTYLR